MLQKKDARPWPGEQVGCATDADGLQVLCTQRAKSCGGRAIPLCSSWSPLWWMMSPRHGRLFFLPLCFNSVWLQVLNIAQAFASVIDLMVDGWLSVRWCRVGVDGVYMVAHQSIKTLHPLLWRMVVKLMEQNSNAGEIQNKARKTQARTRVAVASDLAFTLLKSIDSGISFSPQRYTSFLMTFSASKNERRGPSCSIS